MGATRSLTNERLAEAAHELARKDPDLARILAAEGVPPLWARRPGFATLVRIVLEQQVSLASGAAVYRRMKDAIGPVTPASVQAAGERGLRALGITRQKAAYCVNVARGIDDGVLDLRRVARSKDAAAMAALLRIKGVGPWTAEVYLLMALRRPDVWPAGDIALASAAQTVKRLRRRPSPERLARLAEAWRPHRASAARMLWQHYLNARRS